MDAEHRVIIKVDAQPNTPVGWLKKSKAVDSAATAGGAMFAAIAGLLAQLHADSELLDQTQAKAANKGKLEIKARNSQWRALQKSLRAFANGVQVLCDGAPDAAHALAIAAAASLDAKLAPVRVMPDPKTKAFGNGAVRVYGRRPVPKREGAFFEWNMSTDGGKTWTSLGTTNKARTQVSGLTPGSSVSFRYRTTFKNVTSDWSQTSVLTVL